MCEHIPLSFDAEKSRRCPSHGNKPETKRLTNMATTQLHRIAGTRCERCGCNEKVLLDPDDRFTVTEDGQITFPPGDWGLDIDCECPACGFAADLGTFYEWVEVTDEHRELMLDPSPANGIDALFVSLRERRERNLRDVLTGKSLFLSRPAAVGLLVELMHWARRNDVRFDELVTDANREYQTEIAQIADTMS